MKINFITKIGVVAMGLVLFIGINVYAQQGDSGIINQNAVPTSASVTLSAGESGSNGISGGESGSNGKTGGESGSQSVTDKNAGNMIGLQNPLKVKTIGGLIQSAVEIFSYLVIIFAVLAFIWVGLQYILARGNSERMKELSKWLGYIVIGVAVVIGARVIISIVITTLSSTGIVDERVIKTAEDALKTN